MRAQTGPKSVPKLDPKRKASGKRCLWYYDGFWLPEWDPNSIKKASLKCMFFASVFLEFWLHFGDQFLHKMGQCCEVRPSFFGLRCGTPFLARHGGGTPSDRFQNGSILEGLDLDFGGFGTPFCDVFVTTWLPYALQSWSFLAVLF